MKHFIKEFCTTFVQISWYGIECSVISLAIMVFLFGCLFIFKAVCAGEVPTLVMPDDGELVGTWLFFMIVSFYIVEPINEWIIRHIYTDHTSHT